MNGMITTNENYNIEEIIPKLKAYTTGNVVDKVTCEEKRVLSGAENVLHSWISAQKIILPSL